MSSKVTLDQAGRVVLPKSIRDELRLFTGDVLDVEVTGGGLSLRPRRGATPLQKERGVWVFRTGKALTGDETAKALHDIRERRHLQNADSN
jgi:AbrB family looped-hinge helix DNA binding protein